MENGCYVIIKQIIQIMNKIILIAVVVCLVDRSSQLSAQEVSKYCHCDLTPSYCDMSCCCDTDCSSVISNECFMARSSLFCINSSYYFKIDSSLTPSPSLSDCYYYNQTDYQQQEVNISSKQINNIVQQGVKDIPLEATSPAMDKGYKIALPIFIDAKNLFNFINTDGTCTPSGSTTGVQQQIAYRIDTDIICTASDNSINLFTNILGKKIPSFYSSLSPTLEIPQIAGSFTEATVYFFIGRYGSGKTDYIQNVSVVGSTGQNTNVRKLSLRFIDPQIDLTQQEDSPSFFPQIPYDIFYPIHQIAYSFW